MAGKQIAGMRSIRKATLTLSLLMLLWQLHAQRGPEVGGWLGVSNYFGDLNTRYDLGLPGPAGGVLLRYNFNERLAWRLSGNYGMARGNDARSDNYYERTRNLMFRSSLLEVAGQLEFNFLPYIHGSYENFFSPYLAAGLQYTHFRPRALYEGTWYDLQPLGTEGQLPGDEYRLSTFGVSTAFGLKFDLSYRWSMNLEVGIRKLFTDYLDDVSTTYPDPLVLASQRDPLAVILSDRSTTDPKIGDPGRQRGDSRSTDNYTFLGIGLVYYFGQVACPSISR